MLGELHCSTCEADRVMIVVQTVWLQEERGLSLCRPVAGMIGSVVATSCDTSRDH